MKKRKISARQAVVDIRSGLDDSALMEKYDLSAIGLQSLFDKLVTSGYLDFSEIQQRAPAFLGTVVISGVFSQEEIDKARDGHQQPKRKSATLVNAHEAARDIRSGMDDFSLMGKYRLSSIGLRSLFSKLISVGLIQQLDLDRRHFGEDHTVDLAEDMLSLSAALAFLEASRPAVSAGKAAGAQPREIEPAALPADSLKDVELTSKKTDAGLQRTGTRAFTIVAWIISALVLLTLVSLQANWPVPRFP